MNPSSIRSTVAALLIIPAVLACSGKGAPADAPAQDHSAMAHGGMDAKITLPPGSIVKAVDVQFMQGMIAHHAQAVFMTRLAETRGASPRVLFLARKIDQSQMPEIILMQQWLAHYKQFVPDTASYHNMTMPGMLTKEQVANLEKARDVEFDRQFLQLMIQHHEGALKMVADLLATPGAAQEVDIGVFANEVDQVQTAEIAIMRQMLADL